MSVLKGGNTYTLSGTKGNVVIVARTMLPDGTSTSFWLECNKDRLSHSKEFPDGRILQFIALAVPSGETVNDVFYPMFNRGSSPAPYKPYRAEAVDAFPISSELRAFLADKGYGRGVEGYHNYINFERKVFVQRVGEIDLGTLSWTYRNSNNRSFFDSGKDIPNLKGEVNSITPLPAIIADYKSVAVDVTWVNGDISYSYSVVGLQRITIVDNRYTNAEAFRQAVSGKKLIYALETPIETDISAYLTNDNFIQVEGGGAIAFKNTYEYAAPSTLEYIFKTEGA